VSDAGTSAPVGRPSGGTSGSRDDGEIRRIALLGNPNTGKTTLFNQLSGLKAKTSNFPGTTLEARRTFVRAGSEGGRDGVLIDLPGIYSLELDQLESRVCREVLAGTSAPIGERAVPPECAVVVVDAANLARNLMLVGEVMRRRLPMAVVLNMMDVARAKGIDIDPARLGAALGCVVVVTNARSGHGVDGVRRAIRDARIPTPEHAVPGSDEGLREWADEVADHGVAAGSEGPHRDILDETRSDRVDRVLLNPALGLLVFAGVMTGLFYTLFVLAHYPMGWIDALFNGNAAWVGSWMPGWLATLAGSGLTGAIEAAMPEGVVRDLLSQGVVAGVGSTVIFLPQICLLFFLISLLEDTGYLARGAFLMDRLLRPFGLPGHAFVPLLSSHACALPGIMAARAIPDMKERLATILVAPFMTCSARLPVYVLLTTLLFRDRPALAALAFVGCYGLGIFAGVGTALIARRTILKGKSRPMAMELPTYKWPSVRNAMVTTRDRGWTFLKNAGVNILLICIVLWWLGAYPHVAPPKEATALREQASALVDSQPERAEELSVTAVEMELRHAKAESFMGIIGRTVQPVFAPLGFDWQLTVGVMASFAAREVFVSTMTVVIAGQESDDAAGDERLMTRLHDATRSDGATPIFTPATSWSLLVFFVLAMQCLPTLAVTAREAGSMKWALLQLVWMTGVAYGAAALAYAVMA